jgi:hypothetical protein
MTVRDKIDYSYTTCIICGTRMGDYRPEYCCNGIDCACRGLPIEPPVCSEECWQQFNKEEKCQSERE